MKNNPNPLWTSLYSSPCSRGTGSLKAAIFTTFEAPDTAFLVEDFLPEILGLDRRLSDVSNEYFWAELDDKLKRSNITIISSFGKEISNDYKWLWKYIQNYSTGCNNKAIQHAKLWLIHREGINNDKPETLEIHISSANLTKSAFEKQIQSTWRTVISLSKESAESNRKSWGVLPLFLEELGKSCGNCELIDYFQDLLEKAKAPNDVTFLASVPGTYNRRKPWGSHGLSKLKLDNRGSTKIGVLVPYVGNLNQKDLKYWTGEIDGNLDDLTLMWIDKNHPWANDDNWKMQSKTFKNLSGNGAKIVKFDSIVHDEQPEWDNRWNHSKIYEIQKGNSRRIIVTSANFSPSAWGKRVNNGIKINNFEFGVVIRKKSGWSLIEKSELLDELIHDDAHLTDDIQESPNKGLVWALAKWDGQKINVKARTVPNNKHPNRTITIFCDKKLTKNIEEMWQKESKLWEWSTDWFQNKNGIPNSILINYNSHITKIPLIDSRQYDEKELDPIPEVDLERSRELKYALLLERYGGQFVNDADETPEYLDIEEIKSLKNPNNRNSNCESDYSLSWLVQSREWFTIIDNWANKYDTSLYEIEKDGEKFIEYFSLIYKESFDIGISVAAKVVAEEFKMRIAKGGENGKKS
jgi:Tyrosyl-DNA phosphodiesterase